MGGQSNVVQWMEFIQGLQVPSHPGPAVQSPVLKMNELAHFKL